MSEATTVAALPNTEIDRGAETSLGVYWKIGKFASVRVSGKHFLCLRCKVADTCAHIDRLRGYFEETATTGAK